MEKTKKITTPKQIERIIGFLCGFTGRFHKMKNSGTYYVTVIEDTRTNQLIGSATLVIEYKFIHGCGLVCSSLLKLFQYLF